MLCNQLALANGAAPEQKINFTRIEIFKVALAEGYLEASMWDLR